MTTFAYTLTVASLVLFAGFVLLGVWKFGLLPSYSAYADKWAVAVHINHANLWSIVTMTVAFLMAIPMILIGDDKPWQFLGFLTPVYLGIVSCTPNWQHSTKQYRVHVIGAFACAVGAIAWLLLVRRQFPIVGFSLLAGSVGALATKSLCRTYTFWGEMVMFTSVYISLLIPGA